MRRSHCQVKLRSENLVVMVIRNNEVIPVDFESYSIIIKILWFSTINVGGTYIIKIEAEKCIKKSR